MLQMIEKYSVFTSAHAWQRPAVTTASVADGGLVPRESVAATLPLCGLDVSRLTHGSRSLSVLRRRRTVHSRSLGHRNAFSVRCRDNTQYPLLILHHLYTCLGPSPTLCRIEEPKATEHCVE